MDKNRGLDKDQTPAGAERRDRKASSRPDRTPAPRGGRKPTVLGVVVIASAVGAWLLRRERIRAPEGTWRDALLSETPRRPGDLGASRRPEPETDDR